MSNWMMKCASVLLPIVGLIIVCAISIVGYAIAGVSILYIMYLILKWMS